MAAAHVFVGDVDDPVLDEDDRHHLARVLRLRPGEVVTVSDGRGALRACEWVGDGRIVPAGPPSHVDAPVPSLTVAVAVTKGDRTDLAVQKLTECGIDSIVLFVAERSVARWEGDRAARHVGRLRRVAREAAMQSRRTWLPDVAFATFADVAGRPGAAMADPDGGQPSLDHPVLLVGPEGGWSAAEASSGLPRVALGPHVLRAETAAVAGGAILAALRAGLVNKGRNRPEGE